MSKKLSTTLTLAVTALKNLEERKGASPHDICNYISSVYNVPKDVTKRKALVALKRGTSYGLLKETCGRYNILTDTEKECLELTNQELGLLNLNCRKRRLERKRRLRGSSKQTVKGKISRPKKSLTSSNSCKSSRGKRNKNKKKKKKKGKSISKSGNKRTSRSRRKNSTIKRGKSCVCPPGGNRRARKSKSRSTSRSRKKRSKSNSRRSRSRKPKGKRITKSANKLTCKSRSKSKSKTRSRSKSKSKTRKRSRSKSTSKRRSKKIKVSKKTGKKKRSTSCECPTNPARKIVPKSTGNDSQKTDKSKKIKKENKKKRVKKDKENKEPKKDNCLYHFLGVSSGNLMDTRLNY
ncbi:GSCOCG00007673001-RA-CDS [Cotesia congregata]|uniref:H15 domain-containing protein n=1 Tax=Cotesia congregata TaxID=51543 RepID=A0A8J2HFC0_COTCN|nr:GSCOCG00007673001-RA-CDS [Cotesia congregata]CAG5099385.1 Protein of unknown function [Cotesia congregata]